MYELIENSVAVEGFADRFAPVIDRESVLNVSLRPHRPIWRKNTMKKVSR